MSNPKGWIKGADPSTPAKTSNNSPTPQGPRLGKPQACRALPEIEPGPPDCESGEQNIAPDMYELLDGGLIDWCLTARQHSGQFVPIMRDRETGL